MEMTPSFEWRDGWEPFDPLRPCYTCGSPPSHYFDRYRNEPAYACHHNVIDDDHAYGCWSTRAESRESEEALRRAVKIIKDNTEHGWKSKYIPREGELAAKARGIVAELVASRLTGLPHNKGYLRPSYRRSRKRADIGENVEVRNTKDHTGPLVLYDNDSDERVALLVTGIDPFVLRGWIRVKHGKLRHLYKRDGDLEKWSVPQSMLHPMPLPVDA